MTHLMERAEVSSDGSRRRIFTRYVQFRSETGMAVFFAGRVALCCVRCVGLGRSSGISGLRTLPTSRRKRPRGSFLIVTRSVGAPSVMFAVFRVRGDRVVTLTANIEAAVKAPAIQTKDHGLLHD